MYCRFTINRLGKENPLAIGYEAGIVLVRPNEVEYDGLVM